MLSPMVGYAVTALGYLALHPEKPAQVRLLAERLDIPAPYLAKIVHRLSRKGYVRTRRGLGGGVQLAVDPADTTLLELCEQLEDPILVPQCMLGLGACDDDKACPAHTFARTIRTRQMEFLRRTTLLDAGRFDERRRGEGRERRKGGR